MLAIGPDFKSGFSDPAPVGNADIAATIAQAAGLHLPESAGTLRGRVIAEALAGGPDAPAAAPLLLQSDVAPDGIRTVVHAQVLQQGGATFRYLDAGGFPGRTVGLGE
jgi:hypothetical protein